MSSTTITATRFYPAAFRDGGPAVLITDGARPGVHLVAAAGELTTVVTAFLVRHGSGLLEAVVGEDACERLAIPLSPAIDRDSRAPAQRVTVDAAEGISTGISAADRTRTIRLLADPASSRHDLVRPGHVLVSPGSADDPGPAGAALTLCARAGAGPAAVLCDVVDPADPRRLLTAKDPTAVRDFAAAHGLAVVRI